jgi:hypothetical protein
MHAQGALRFRLTSLKPQRFPLPAFMIIATVRGFLLNFGVYHATRSALQLPFEVRTFSPPLPSTLSNLLLSLAVEPGHNVHHVLCHHVRNRDRNHQGAPPGM